MWDNPATGVLFVLLMTIGGLLVGTAVGLLVAQRQANRYYELEAAYWQRPLHDGRSFDQWRRDQKKAKK